MPLAKGELRGLLWVFELDDRSDRWEQFLAEATRLGHRSVLQITAEFSSGEVSAAEWCHLSPQWHHGYPQPEDTYLEVSYDQAGHCPVCHIGLCQSAPLRMRAEPDWGRRSIMQMFWIYDAWFVTPEAHSSVFAPYGVASRPVLSKSGRTLERVVQLTIDEIVPLVENRTQGEMCDTCSRFKLHERMTDFAPKPARMPDSPLVQSELYYGSGGSAFRDTLVRRDLVAAIRSAGLRGATFHPCAT
ncbi:hypothetical protein [Agromyces bauzanensis]|uniref:Uncharacterized protein n=1 Tax=Agromyces bauzanensis TaxID=1308924 RepID=A0A917PGJ7_9MICO|nr:hypothetical protein [Agromyces bauzanensis]GGJ76606.1 hypothetical protein GCM10011372_13530 [Agromyces bauzanensis]